ncbi:MAG: M20 metallopeptidase family protein [Solitalea-like symbiont of Acarus siro]
MANKINANIKGDPQNLYWTKYIPTQKVIQWRRHIHENPELSFKEVNTALYVENILNSLGNIEIVKPTKTSVIGILHGAKPGKVVAFRADMDALPVQEETGLPYASKVAQVSHACGHDTHTAMLLGTASVLSKIQKDVKGTIYFIFQHAEESLPGGAREIIETGVLNKVQAFFGMHIMPGPSIGSIGVMPAGPASTASDRFNLKIIGKGAHGSMPNLSIDPIVIGAQVVNNLQTIVSRNVEPGNLAVLTIGKFHSGKAVNVIPDKAELGGSIRTITEDVRQLMATNIKRVIDNTIKAQGATYELKYTFGYNSIVNDKALVDLSRQSAIKAVGAKHVKDIPMMTASEDFSYYRKIAPICFLILTSGQGPINHNAKFNPSEDAFVNGIKTQVQILLDYLG